MSKKDQEPEASGAHLVVFDELDYQDMTPLRIYLGEEAWNKLMDALEAPPAPSEKLKKLFKDNK